MIESKEQITEEIITREQIIEDVIASMGEFLKTLDVIAQGTKIKNHPDECPKAFELIKNIILGYKKSLSVMVE